ncbi:MAG: MltA domain-containing protein [Bacteriovoracaceae bacterium]
MSRFFLSLLLLSSFHVLAVDYTTPTKLVTDPMTFEDDLDFYSLDLAIDRQITSLGKKALVGTIKLGDTVYPRQKLVTSVKLFKEFINDAKACIMNSPLEKPGCMDDLNQKIENNFDLYTPNWNEKDPEASRPKPAMFTAYYSPDFVGSKTKTEKYQYGIYSLPKEATLRTKTRDQIDFEGALENKGLALFYVENLYDLYLMHIEGGGRVTVKDDKGKNTSYYLSFAGTNGKPNKFISSIMVQMGYLKPGKASNSAIRAYLNLHPEKMREIFSQCENYIFFSVTGHPPLGMNNTILTDNRSIATDSKLYAQKGLLSYIVAKRPILTSTGAIKYIPFSRFFLDQDTGGAIKGKARADIYFGFGAEAELAAGNMTTYGDIYFLIEKLVKVEPTPVPTLVPVVTPTTTNNQGPQPSMERLPLFTF